MKEVTHHVNDEIFSLLESCKQRSPRGFRLFFKYFKIF